MRILKILIATGLILSGCKSAKEAQVVPEKKVPSLKSQVYRASVTKSFDLIHTRLEVDFDWKMRTLSGKAYISMKPHFYESNEVVLNARGMQINEVAIQQKVMTRTPYIYRNDSLIITLDRIYSRNDTLTLFIDYLSRPESLPKHGGSAAIANDKGLYFINHDGSNPYKPKQLWTQGETQSSSVWFPTIDAPNQKMTQEIAITVDTGFVTLSNGLLTHSEPAGNGKRTDYWKQTLPHAPYLVMMAIGEFAVVKDKWRDREVSYYVEPYFEKSARKTFGNTPEMLEVFSKKLGVDYPWEKYAQVVVRDYVSGAMENTSATLHGEFMNLTERELLDFTGEEYISHELFHHWFGDLVTCESWSNIPLNESFATYGEYIWNEHKYGREDADYHLKNELNNYLQESKSKQVDLIRFHYNRQEDMFDRHSYEKGGCILHMLRKYVGDDAFYRSLNLYLNRHRFSTVEIHDLRQVFEEVTGEDLNWFFNQWFFASGHPQLDISYAWDENRKESNVVIHQTGSNENAPLYKLPLEVDIYVGGTVTRERIVIDKPEAVFTFKADNKPELINVDAEKVLPGTKNDHHTIDEFIYMYNHARVYNDKAEAIMAVAGSYEHPSPSSELLLKAMHDSHWSIRQYAIANSENLLKGSEEARNTLKELSAKDPVSAVKSEALRALLKFDATLVSDDMLHAAVNDSSYSVASIGLTVLTERNPEEGLALARKMEDPNVKFLNELLLSIYAFYGNDEQHGYVNEVLMRTSGYNRYQVLMLYGAYLKRLQNDSLLLNGINTLHKSSLEEQIWFVRAMAVNTLTDLQNHVEKNFSENKSLILSIETALADIRLKEKDERILKLVNE